MSQQQAETGSSNAQDSRVMGYRGPEQFMNAIVSGNHGRAVTKNELRERREAKTLKQQRRHRGR